MIEPLVELLVELYRAFTELRTEVRAELLQGFCRALVELRARLSLSFVRQSSRKAPRLHANVELATVSGPPRRLQDRRTARAEGTHNSSERICNIYSSKNITVNIGHRPRPIPLAAVLYNKI